MYLEDLCFDAQQAAEKALKALLLHRRVNFPRIHDLTELLIHSLSGTGSACGGGRARRGGSNSGDRGVLGGETPVDAE
jgi:hypothetical protein